MVTLEIEMAQKLNVVNRPSLLAAQISVADEDLFGSGEDDSDDQDKGKSTDKVFQPTNEQVVDEVFPANNDHVVRKSIDQVDEVFIQTNEDDVIAPGNDDVFMRNSDQVVPGSDSYNSSEDSNSSAQLRREIYRRSRESDNLEDTGIRRSLSLPDIVPKGLENETDSFKSRRQNLSDNSPDVVSSSSNKSSTASSNEPVQSIATTKEQISILRQNSQKNPKLSRSVSFSLNEKKNEDISVESKVDDDDSSSDADRKRREFRSSGYGTGESDKASSVQSQLSQGSVFDGGSFNQEGLEHGESRIDHHGANSDKKSKSFDEQRSSLDQQISDQLDGMTSCNPCKEDNLVGLLSPSSNESDSEKITVKSGNKHKQYDLIPNLSAISQSSLTIDTPPINGGSKDSHSGSSSSVQSPNQIKPSQPSIQISSSDDSNSSIQIPNFDVLLNECRNSSSGSSSDTSDSLKHVQKKYCKTRDELKSQSPPAFATCLPQSPIHESVDTGIFSRTTASETDHSHLMSSGVDYFDYKSCKDYMTREILQQQNISEDLKLELIESPITPSPRDYTYVIQPRITSETVEKSSRCRDVHCSIKFCLKVREGFIGLNHTLDGQWPYGFCPDVNDLCYGLGKHSTAPCDELKCAVKWCYFLSAEFSDQPRGEFVYRALKRYYDTPVMSATAFPPNLKPHKFYKLDEHYRRDHAKYGETMTTFGDYGNVYMMDDLTVIKKVKFQNYDCDIDNTVYKKLFNRQHKHIVDHIWAAVYNDIEEIHICTTFFRGGTLEDLLQSRMLLNPVIVQEYLLQILDAVIYLHDKCGIIYLYWTTSNMLFLDPIRKHILISNLSLSVPSNTDFDVGYIKQSLPPCLTPPEIMNGDEGLRLTGETDCWGLGCMTLEMLIGKQMWYNERHYQKTKLIEKIKTKDISPQQYIPRHRMPEIFHSVLARCFEFDVKNRIGCEELQSQLKNWKYN